MDPKPIKLYAREDSPRLRYIASILLGDILGLNWEFTADRRKLRSGKVVNYSDCDIPGAFRIVPHSLLFEKNISEQDIKISSFNSLPVFFSAEDSDFPFDIFAASFYLVSRYEEYLDNDPDEHGRFRASSSLAFRNGFLQLPVVDLWTREFSKALLLSFRNIAFRSNDFKAILTVDVDQAFAYLGKSIFRTIGGVINDIKDSRDVSKRYRTVMQHERDPYNVFDFIESRIESTGTDARFFFLCGNYSQFDKNPSWKSAEYRKLIESLSGKYNSGLHPSYRSFLNAGTLVEECSRYAALTGKRPANGRFHYLRFTLPLSYRQLLEAGITSDYSMGYADEPGFRAGIARPFNYYDLPRNTETGLQVYPFQVMDGMFFQYRKDDPETAMKIIASLISATRHAGGTFISIWHNTSLIDDEIWGEWRKVFEFMLNCQSGDRLS